MMQSVWKRFNSCSAFYTMPLRIHQQMCRRDVHLDPSVDSAYHSQHSSSPMEVAGKGIAARCSRSSWRKVRHSQPLPSGTSRVALI
jgi:hypothetical protein